jgi:hypothetical protein
MTNPYQQSTAQITLYALGTTTLGGAGYGEGTYGYGAYGYGTGAGGGFITMGPQLARVWWLPEVIYCSTPSQSLSQFYLYRNGTAQANLIGWTLSGNGDQVPFIGGPLTSGEFLVGQWIGGDNGVQATMTITGQQQVPGA